MSNHDLSTPSLHDALPIYCPSTTYRHSLMYSTAHNQLHLSPCIPPSTCYHTWLTFTFRGIVPTNVWDPLFPWERSEERRVGKECRAQWSAHHYIKKKKKDE